MAAREAGASARPRDAQADRTGRRVELCLGVRTPAQPLTLLQLDLPLATRLKSRTSAAASLGGEPWVFTRRRNSS
jgi:hypothetical protein